MEISNLIPHIEALVFASDKPLTAIDITELINNAFGFMEDKVTLDQVESSIEGIVEKYNSEFYPFEVKQSGGGWQFLTKKDYHKTIAQLNGEKFLKRLSAAALETLAIIAYKQPITKGEIETIRGVSTDYTIQKLLEKELIVISGRNEQLPGHPLIYSTSKSFMDYFGVNSADDLPKIKEILANQMMEGTIINHAEFEQASTLAVTDDGELIEEAQTSEDVITENENTEIPDIVSSDLEISEPAEENESEDNISSEQYSGGENESKPADENGESEEDNTSGDEASNGDESAPSDEQQ
jgi:segregation and condensation protein B